MSNMVTLKTVLPISVVIIIVTVTLYIASLKALAGSNEQAVKELKESRSQSDYRLNEFQKTLYKIDGKLDLLLKQ